MLMHLLIFTVPLLFEARLALVLGLLVMQIEVIMPHFIDYYQPFSLQIQVFDHTKLLFEVFKFTKASVLIKEAFNYF